jgi:hypothetical protein
MARQKNTQESGTDLETLGYWRTCGETGQPGGSAFQDDLIPTSKVYQYQNSPPILFF